MQSKRILMYANTAWYLYNFRLDLAQALLGAGYRVIMLAPHDEYIAKLKSCGFEVYTLPMNRKGLNPFEELLLLFRLTRMMFRLKPTIVFNFTIKCVLHGSIAARLSGVRQRVNAVAGMGSIYSHPGMKYQLLRPFVSLMLRLALSGRHSRLIVQNVDDKNVFLDNQLIPEFQLALIKGSGVCGRKFVARECRHGSTELKVLFAARLLRAKGIEDFVELARRFADRPQVKFLIAGKPDEGNQDSVSLSELKVWEKQHNITLLGHVERMDHLLAEVDVVCLPSQYGEGVPRILVEAAATGLPLLGYDVPGTREIIKHEHNGYLSERGDVEVLFRSLSCMIADPKLRGCLGAASRHLFEREFEAGSVNARTLALIAETFYDPSRSGLLSK